MAQIMDKITLYLDEDIRVLLADILRQRGYDAIHVLEAKRDGLTDPEQLSYAVNQKRAILTHNIRDFLLLDQRYQAEEKAHYGIIVSDQIPLGELLRRTLKCLNQYTAEEAYNHVIWLHNFK
jgi:predicted nuclease of predicted toxin-antitoxin system